MLDLNKTQASVLTLVFAYCDDQRLPLLDLADLRTTLKFLSSDEGKPALEEYGGFSKATVGVLLRSIVELEATGADAFFGEPEFDVHDLMRATDDGRGIVTLLELADVMDRPACSRPSCCGCSRSSTHSFPRKATCRSPSSRSSSTRRTCCSTTRARL